MKYLSLILLLLLSHMSMARDYIIANGNTSSLPACFFGSWSQSGSQFTCSGRVTLNSGDTLQVSSAVGEVLNNITLYAYNGFQLNNNVIGNSTKNISLHSSYGTVVATGTNTLAGDIITDSGSINLNNMDIDGSINTPSNLTMNGGRVRENISANNGVNLTDTYVDGTVSASAGQIVMNGGEVHGLVHSNCCVIRADGTDLYDGVRSDANSIYISNATVAGDFYAANNPAEFTGVVMTSGSITGASLLTVNDSTLGSSSSPVIVTTQSGAITLNDSLAYGDLTTPNWTSVVANGSSVVVGTCTPRSTPTSACQETEPLTCISDNFNRSATGADWVVSSFNGNFTPSIRSNRLLLTEDNFQQATAATLQRLFPADGNKIVVEFDHYAWSPGILSGADGITLVFSDARVTPQAGSYGGSLGYAQRDNGDPGFAGGWLGVALDEYGNFSNPTEGRIGGPGFESNSVTVRGSGQGQNGYRYITGAHRISPGIDRQLVWFGAAPGYRYRITIDASSGSSTQLSVERDTGFGFSQLISPLDISSLSGQAAIPDDLVLSLTGSTGDSSNFHAIDNLQVCANKINSMDALVHHFEFVYASNAVTCSAQEVLVRACANESCSSLYNGDVRVSLSPSGWEGGDTQTIRRGEGSLRLWHTSPGQVELAVSGSSPLSRAYTSNLCVKDGGVKTTDCRINFSDSGFIVDTPDVTAAQPTTASILAVRKDKASQRCVPAFADVRKDVSLWGSYVNPGSSARVVSWPVQVDGKSIAMAANAAGTQRLNFDSEGRAEFDLNYDDAGLMQLNARYDGTGGDDGLILEGSSQFVSSPAGFCIVTGGECSRADDSCPAFKAAGEEFPVTVQSMGWQRNGDTDFCRGNTPTPSFAMDNMQLSSQVVSPAGGSNGVVSPASYNHQAAADNLNTVNVTESEVGVFNFSLTSPGNYFGVTLPQASSAATGRFYPHHFASAVINAGELNAGCAADNAFSYSGENIEWLTAPRIQLTAQNSRGVTTRNYTQSGFLKLTADNVIVNAPSADGSALNTEGDSVAFNSQVNNGLLSVVSPGVMQYDLNAADVFSYGKMLINKIAPFNPDLAFRLFSATDSDGAALLSQTDFNPSADFAVRYGRLQLDNAYGPETMDLGLNMHTEYFDGNGFVLNADDSCWNYNSIVNVSLTPVNVTAVVGMTGTLSNGIGEDAVWMTAPVNIPGTTNTGDVQVIYSAPLWLQDDFDGDGELEDPEGTASFGVYRGHDRIIYWREVNGF